MKKICLLTGMTIFLAACGGGGSGASPSQPTAPVVTDKDPQGFWVGSSSNGRDVRGVVLDNGQFYVLYTTLGSSTIAGVVQGSSTVSGSTFSSSDAKDFNLEGLGVLDANVSATITEKTSFNGSIKYGAQTVTFTSSYDASYEQVPSLSQLSGTFNGTVAFGHANTGYGVENALVQIGQDGSMTGVGESGCSMTGVVSTHTNGNIYDMDITFGGAPCYFSNMTLQGILYFESETGTAIGAAPVSARDAGLIFSGTKQ